MKVAIIGTRGIPNNHGGFEQFAEYLAPLLVENDFEVTVYSTHNHPYQKSSWKGVDIVHCYNPEHLMGTAGQFVYDFNCIMDTRKRDFDIILQLGYTSSSVWGSLYPKKSIITTNMDGLEWKRSKYSRPVQRFLQFAEKLAVKHSNYLISDSVGIQEYLLKKYAVSSDYIPYGANNAEECDPAVLRHYGVLPYQYNMLIARMEPENSVEVILDGVAKSSSDNPFLVVGKHENKFGRYLKEKYSGVPKIRFVGGIYDIEVLNNLRNYSCLYFHGHTVGGTNPSLLEAMASNSLICAHRNIFNRSILKKNAYYFEDAEDVRELVERAGPSFKLLHRHQQMLDANAGEIRERYSWQRIAGQYMYHFNSIRHHGSLIMDREVMEEVGVPVAV